MAESHFTSQVLLKGGTEHHKLIDQMVDKDLLTSYADIFQLDKNTIEDLERMGSKSAHNLIDAIENSRQITFGRFLFALGIRYVGEHVAGILADSFDHLNNLSQASRSDLEAIDGIGPTVAASVERFFQQPENHETVTRLLKRGVKLKYETGSRSELLKGQVFVLTGSLVKMTRKQAKEKIEAAGGKVTGSISGNTNYLVAGKSPGTKLIRAEELGVKIIDEAALEALLP